MGTQRTMTDKPNYSLQFAFPLRLFYSLYFFRSHIVYQIFLRLLRGLTTLFHTHSHSPSVHTFLSVPSRHSLSLLLACVLIHSRTRTYYFPSFHIVSMRASAFEYPLSLSCPLPDRNHSSRYKWRSANTSRTSFHIARIWHVVTLVLSFSYAPIWRSSQSQSQLIKVSRKRRKRTCAINCCKKVSQILISSV